MSSRTLHKTLRERVRRELRSSPSHWNDYLRRRSTTWRARILLIAGRIYVVLGAIVMSICLGSMAAMPVFFGLDPEQAALVADPSSAALWSLVGLALCLTGCSLSGALYLRELVWSSRDLIVLAYYPISDRRYWRWQMMRLTGGAALGIIVSGIVLGAIAYTRMPTLGAWSAVAIFSLLDWVVIAATAMLIAAQIRWPLHDEFVLIAWALPLIVGGCFLAIGGARFGALPTWIACAIFAVLPSGSTHGAFYFGVIEGLPAGWLYLLPATFVVGLAIRWLTSTFGIRELAFIDGKASIVSLGETTRLTAPRSWAIERQARTAIARGGVAGLGARSTAATPLSERGSLFRSLDSARRGWVERLVAPRLSGRQRLLLEFSCPGPPAWTLAWRMSFFPAAISGVLLWWAGARNEKGEAEMLIAICNWMAAGVSILHGGYLSARPWYFPVSLRELMNAGLTQAIWRGAVGLPVIFGFNLAGTLLGGGSPREAVLRVAAYYLVVFAWYLFGSCLVISSSTNDTANRWVFLGWIGMIFLLGSLSLVSFLPLGFYQVFSSAAAFLLAWAMSRRYIWMLEHAAIDIVR